MCHLSVLLNKTGSRHKDNRYSSFSKSYRVRMHARTRKVSQKPLYLLSLSLHRVASPCICICKDTKKQERFQGNGELFSGVNNY